MDRVQVQVAGARDGDARAAAGRWDEAARDVCGAQGIVVYARRTKIARWTGQAEKRHRSPLCHDPE